MKSYSGLLITPEQKQQAGYQGLLNLGTQLMAAGGYSDKPTSFAQALGQGGQGFMQGYQGAMDLARQQGIQNLQAKTAQQRQALGEQKLEAGERQAAGEQAFMDWVAGGRKGPMPITPQMAMQQPTAAIQNWQFSQNLPESDRAGFSSMLGQAGRVDLGTEWGILDRAGNVIQRIPKNLAAAESEKAGGKIVGTEQAIAEMGLPQATANARELVGLVDALIAHPGMKSMVGAPEPTVTSLGAMVAGSPIRGTPEAGFEALKEQIQGKQFLEAFQSLKGSGQITELEGKQATAALSRLGKTNVSEEEYMQAADELKEVVMKALERQQAKAGLKPNTTLIGGQTSAGVVTPDGAPAPADPLGLR